MDRKIGPSVKVNSGLFRIKLYSLCWGKFKNVPCKNFLLDGLYFLKEREEFRLKRTYVRVITKVVQTDSALKEKKIQQKTP